jgi:putative membrane protein
VTVVGTALPFEGLHLGEFLPPTLACLAYLGLYIKRARTVAARGSPVGRRRAACFAFGAASAALVQLPPLDSLADQVLLVHMAQHVLLGDICSLFVVLGLTGPMLRPLLQVRATRPLRVATHPVAALILWAGDLYAWHIPFLYQLAIRHDLVHALEHACLLWFGALLWLSLLGPLPKPRWFGNRAALVHVFAVRTVGAVLGNVLIFLGTVAYPVYDASDAARGLSPLSDQNIAGALMMVEQMLLTAVLLGWLFLRWLRQEGDRQDLLDLAAARGVELSGERAGRAAGAGSAARLRERLLQSPR